MTENVRIGTTTADELIAREKRRHNKLLRDAKPPVFNVWKLIKRSWYLPENTATVPEALLFIQAILAAGATTALVEAVRKFTGERPPPWWVAFSSIACLYIFTHLFWRGRWKQVHAARLDQLREMPNDSQLLRRGLERDIVGAHTALLQAGEQVPLDRALRTVRDRLLELKDLSPKMPEGNMGYREGAPPETHETDPKAALTLALTRIEQTREAIPFRCTKLAELAIRVEATHTAGREFRALGEAQKRAPALRGIDEAVSRDIQHIYGEIALVGDAYQACLTDAADALAQSYLATPVSATLPKTRVDLQALRERFAAEAAPVAYTPEQIAEAARELEELRRRTG